MDGWYEARFRQQVEAALGKIRTILENNRNPTFPADISHSYDDKYLLAEHITGLGLAAILNVLESLGLNSEGLKKLKDWSGSRSVTLRLTSTEKCEFDKEVKREIEGSKKHVVEEETTTTKKTWTGKVITTIIEYFWKFDVEYELFAFVGNNPSDKFVLQSRKGQVTVKTTTKDTPRPKVAVEPSIDTNITWLLEHATSDANVSFKIDRTATGCHTPRRNDEVDRAYGFFESVARWSSAIHRYFTGNLFPVEQDHGLDLGSINTNGLFVPVVPLFEKQGTSVILSGDINKFLSEQKRSIHEKFGDTAKIFPANTKLISVAEAKLLVLVLHLKQICQHWGDGIDYIEDMLRKQLIAAIGKIVTPVDFANYMRFHNRKLFKKEFEPRQFCYAIRRPDHYPEGILSIEENLDDGSLSEPVMTCVSRSEPKSAPMAFSINAATKISFFGERYLHAFVRYQFSGEAGSSLKLVARARQFSSFVLLVGRIVSADQFEPKAGIIIQNKDDLKIPLMLEQIPTPKEFRDAIESLSPEQQRFAKAFRALQLESTLFGICVIQIKPQLEKLLKLPNDSLTKEIKLTQELLELFIKYQIPSDLLTYDGDPSDSTPTKLTTVKKYVANMYEMINKAKKEEIEDAKKVYAYNNPAPVPVLYSNMAIPRPCAAPMVMSCAAPMMAPGAPGGGALFWSEGAAAGGPPPPPPPADAVMAFDISPAPPQAQPIVPDQQKIPSSESSGEGGPVAADIIDYTKIPAQMDKKFEALDVDSALRPTIINTSEFWDKTSQKALLAEPSTSTLYRSEQETERNRAFDLLDALSRSGVLSIDQASLHVVIASTHCFDKSLLDTIIKDNVNPIEKVERSVLIVSSTIQNKKPGELIKEDQLDRVKTYSPGLF